MFLCYITYIIYNISYIICSFYVYIIEATRQKSQEEVGHCCCKTENSNATNVEESETVNDETDARSVDSEDEDNEEEDTKVERKTTKKAQKVNKMARLFLNL